MDGHMKSLTSLAIAGLLALVPILGAASMSSAQAQERRAERFVAVAGHGSVEATPDGAEITTGVVTDGQTAREALTANNAAMRKVVDREGGCVVWGGAVRLSPADDILIRVERALDLVAFGAEVRAGVAALAAAPGAVDEELEVCVVGHGPHLRPP